MIFAPWIHYGYIALLLMLFQHSHLVASFVKCRVIHLVKRKEKRLLLESGLYTAIAALLAEYHLIENALIKLPIAIALLIIIILTFLRLFKNDMEVSLHRTMSNMKVSFHKMITNTLRAVTRVRVITDKREFLERSYMYQLSENALRIKTTYLLPVPPTVFRDLEDIYERYQNRLRQKILSGGFTDYRYIFLMCPREDLRKYWDDRLYRFAGDLSELAMRPRFIYRALVVSEPIFMFNLLIVENRDNKRVALIGFYDMNGGFLCGIEIEDPNLANNIDTYFNELWDISRNVLVATDERMLNEILTANGEYLKNKIGEPVMHT